jgi:hypothetical protein
MPRITKALAVCTLLVGSCFAGTSTNASVKGVYVFQFNTSKFEGWNASITCGTNKHTVTSGATTVAFQTVQGTMTLDGKGNITSGSFTQYGNFDQALSNATAVPSCTPGKSSNGNAVYDPPVVSTITGGTYSIEAGDFGTLSPTVDTGNGSSSTFTVILSGAGTIRNVMFAVAVDDGTNNSPNRVEVSGVAILQ